MPVITIANTKGGAGKTTAAVLLAVELAHCGYKVTVFDSDSQGWFSDWYRHANPAGAIQLVTNVTPASLECQIREMDPATDYFIIDLAGERNQLTATALAFATHVLIPVQGSAMDAKGAMKILDLIKQIKSETGYEIPHSVLLSRVNPMVTTHSLVVIKGLLAQRNVNVLNTPIVERGAFREMFDHGMTLYDLDAGKVSNLDRAQSNAREFAAEIMRLLPARIIQSRRRKTFFGWSRAA
jgi:chromosome partitioning protein